MTADEIEILIAKHEMRHIELKESFDAECIETACAFANAQGGRIIIGVTDCGEPSKGLLRREALRDYENRIATATEPSVAVDAEKAVFRGREIVVLRVMENPLKPVAYRGRCFMRKGSVNHQMTPTEIAECHLKSTGGSMDAVFVAGVTKDDLNEAAIRRYMQRAVACGRRSFQADADPWKTLLKLQWVKSETEIIRAAYLLFAKDQQEYFSWSFIHAGAFKADGAYILDSCDVRGNIQDQIEEAISFVQRNIRYEIEISGKAVDDRCFVYPIDALRETIANAVCHRDYGIGNDIQIKILEDSLVVHSPGQLPFDVTLETLESPLHGSFPRNRIIAQAFYDMHIVEQYGSGIQRIKDACRANGNDFPTWESLCGIFSTTYTIRHRNDLKPNRMATWEATEDADNNGGLKSGLKTVDVAIVAAIERNAKSTIVDLMGITGLSRNGVRKAIVRLKSIGVIRRVGPDKGGRWEIVEQSSSNGGNGISS